MFNKFSDIKKSSLAYTSQFIKATKKLDAITVDDAFIVFKNCNLTEDHFMFQKTISQLFLLGKINYDIHTNKLLLKYEN
jgi:hypothetical protein